MTQDGVVTTDSGEWRHAKSDLVFTLIEYGWDEKVKNDVGKAYLDAKAMIPKIKEAVAETSGRKVLNNLYIIDHQAMIEAMNRMDDMGEESATEKTEQGTGTAVEINQEFFKAVLAGVGGDTEPLMVYLTDSMGDFQAQVKKTTFSGEFGTVIGLVSVMPDLNVPVITFKYVYSSNKTSDWLVTVNCGSTEHHSYDYTYTAVDFCYVKPDEQAHK